MLTAKFDYLENGINKISLSMYQGLIANPKSFLIEKIHSQKKQFSGLLKKIYIIFLSFTM